MPSDAAPVDVESRVRDVTFVAVPWFVPVGSPGVRDYFLDRTAMEQLDAGTADFLHVLVPVEVAGGQVEPIYSAIDRNERYSIIKRTDFPCLLIEDSHGGQQVQRIDPKIDRASLARWMDLLTTVAMTARNAEELVAALRPTGEAMDKSPPDKAPVPRTRFRLQVLWSVMGSIALTILLLAGVVMLDRFVGIQSDLRLMIAALIFLVPAVVLGLFLPTSQAEVAGELRGIAYRFGGPAAIWAFPLMIFALSPAVGPTEVFPLEIVVHRGTDRNDVKGLDGEFRWDSASLPPGTIREGKVVIAHMPTASKETLLGFRVKINNGFVRTSPIKLTIPKDYSRPTTLTVSIIGNAPPPPPETFAMVIAIHREGDTGDRNGLNGRLEFDTDAIRSVSIVDGLAKATSIPSRFADTVIGVRIDLDDREETETAEITLQATPDQFVYLEVSARDRYRCDIARGLEDTRDAALSGTRMFLRALLREDSRESGRYRLITPDTSEYPQYRGIDDALRALREYRDSLDGTMAELELRGEVQLLREAIHEVESWTESITAMQDQASYRVRAVARYDAPTRHDHKHGESESRSRVPPPDDPNSIAIDIHFFYSADESDGLPMPGDRFVLQLIDMLCSH